MADRIYLNNDWEFAETFSEEMLHAESTIPTVTVRIPHTCKETPYHYFDETEYQMLSGYRKTWNVPAAYEGKTVLLTFEGVGHSAVVYVNGAKVGEHHCGYTAFTIDISSALRYGSENVIALSVDSREDQNVPPFGFVIDYMTYGGIYRDVYVTVHETSYIEDVFVSTRLAESYMVSEEVEDEMRMYQRCKKSETVSEITVINPSSDMKLRQTIREVGSDKAMILDEKSLSELKTKPIIIPHVKSDGGVQNQPREGRETYILKHFTGDVVLWDIDHPARYILETELVTSDGKRDVCATTFGFRKSVFKENGYYLNGRKVKIRGLNRHQSYPYVGYAMPASMQQYDADILKKELGLNAVRTSHYPQDHKFIDRCDELGLLVFTEFPGWQHIGDEAWKQQAIENERDMIVQYRNHPSIILWGVRINESVDDDSFYRRTNAVAHALDATRQTGGVRCYKKGSFLEDVFTYNDFVHCGTNKGCDKKSDVTPDTKRPYLISEYNGHMYPTKAFDWEEHRLEHALRHANVLDDVAKNTDITGSFGWCMFDYNTHKDFGSGDRICYHGVMDMFRNPKLAAAIYAAQGDTRDVLEVSSSFDIGEHPGSNRGDVYIISNADSVRMYKNDVFIKEYKMTESGHRNMKRGPVLVDDYIGKTLEENENMSHAQAEDVKSLLNSVARVGLYNMPKTLYLKAGRLMVQYHMTMDQAVELYNRYIGNWGGESTAYRFEAIRNGKVVKTLTKCAMHQKDLDITVSHQDLKETHTYDVAAVRIRAVDEYDNLLSFANDPLLLRTEGAVELIGPKVVSLQGGMFGTYVKTVGTAGDGALMIETPEGKEYRVDFKVQA